MAAPVDDGYSETKDLNLEILWQAQRVEDQKLVGLIRERLSRGGENFAPPKRCGQIIPFPLLAAGAVPLAGLSLPPEEPTLWPRRPGRQGVWLSGLYCAAILLFLLFQNL